MEVPIEVILFDGPDKVEKFLANISEQNSDLAIQKLEAERQKIIDYLKMLKEKNLIKSVSRPKNKKYQAVLNNLVKSKKTILNSIKKLKQIYK